MKCVEIWAGTESFSKVARKLGHECWTTDFNPKFNSSHTGDILDYETQMIVFEQVKKADIVWMSPLCTTWSLASGNTHFTEFRQPKTEKSLQAIKMMMFARFIADYCDKHNKLFFIENPNGRAVWIMDNKYLKRCWYCQYGDTRAKPTNIWTNLKDWNPKTCFNGNPSCHHERAKRGSKTGTQGLKGNMERSVIPEKLFYEIFNNINKGQQKLTSKQ